MQPCLERVGQTEGIRADYKRAYELMLAARGPEDVEAGEPLINLARRELADGDVELAREHIATLEKLWGADRVVEDGNREELAELKAKLPPQ